MTSRRGLNRERQPLLKLTVSGLALAGFVGGWVALNAGHDRDEPAGSEGPAGVLPAATAPEASTANPAPTGTVTPASSPTPTPQPAAPRGRQSRGS
jgi:hypothetical protein